MALDLTLTALPPTAHFALDKARARPEYAAEFDKILAPDTLRQHLEMIRRRPDGTPEALLLEMLADAEQLRPTPEPPEYYSAIRGYATPDHLLGKWLLVNAYTLPASHHIFYGGTPLDTNGQHGYFQYLLPPQVAEVQALLGQVTFADLRAHYDFARLDAEGVYKLTWPEHLPRLEEEYAALRAFYVAARAAGAFVLIRLV